MQLHLADSSVRHPEGIAEDVPARVRDCFVPVDLMVLDMDNQKETTLILGWPFLNTADAHIDVGAGEIRLHINGKEEKFDFRLKREQCLMIRVKFGPNLRKSKKSKSHPLRQIVLYLLRRHLWKMIPQAQKGLRRRVNQRLQRPRILFLRRLRHQRRIRRYGAKRTRRHRPLLLLQVWTKRPQPDQVWRKVLLFGP